MRMESVHEITNVRVTSAIYSSKSFPQNVSIAETLKKPERVKTKGKKVKHARLILGSLTMSSTLEETPNRRENHS